MEINWRRGLRLQTMSTNDQNSRGAAAASADRIGKVFVALRWDMREYLICDAVFTKQGAAELADMVTRKHQVGNLRQLQMMPLIG
jgi:hypothetical protein